MPAGMTQQNFFGHDSVEFLFLLFFLNKYISAYTYCRIGATVTHVKISLTCDLDRGSRFE